MKKDIMKKIGGAVLSVLLGLGLGFSGASLMAEPEVHTVEVPVEVEKVVEVPKIVNNTEVVEKIVEVEVVDNQSVDYQRYLEQVEDEDIDYEYVQMTVEAFYNAETHIRENIGDLLDDELDAFDTGNTFEDFQEDEVFVRRVGEPIVMSQDYEAHDVDILYRVDVKAKDGDEYKYASYNITAKIESGFLVDDEFTVVEV